MDFNSMMADQLGAVLRELVTKNGFQFPIHFAVIAANGSIAAGHYKACDFGLDSEFVTPRSPSRVFTPPINVLFVDSRGEAARVIFESEDFGPPANIN